MSKIIKPLLGHENTTSKQLIKFVELLNKKVKTIKEKIYHTDESECEVALEYTAKGNLIGYVIFHQYEYSPTVYTNSIKGRKNLGNLWGVNWVVYQAYTLNNKRNALEFLGEAEYLPLNQDEAYIDEVKVVPKFQRQGVGSAIMSTILRNLHKAGIKYVELDSVDHKDEHRQEPSKISIPNQFYYSLGFENRIVEQDNLFLPRYLKEFTSPMLKKIYPEEEYPKRLACPLHAFMGKKRYYKFVCGLSDEDIRENN